MTNSDHLNDRVSKAIHDIVWESLEIHAMKIRDVTVGAPHCRPLLNAGECLIDFIKEFQAEARSFVLIMGYSGVDLGIGSGMELKLCHDTWLQACPEPLPTADT